MADPDRQDDAEMPRPPAKPDSSPPPDRHRQDETSKSSERRGVFAFGVVCIGIMLLIAIWFPTPEPFQYRIFQTVLALAAAGIAVMIPGFLEVKVSDSIRAGGALAVFVLVMYKSPVDLVIDSVVTIETKPDTVNIAPGAYAPVEYRFRQRGDGTTTVDAQDVRWLLENGQEIHTTRNARILSGSIALPKNGDYDLLDNVYLPPDIAAKVLQSGYRRVNLETTFQGWRNGNGKPIGRAILSINIM